jgi:large subunit ribosomal protein L19
MSYDLIRKVENAGAGKKAKVVDVRSGDTVRVYQKIQEGKKTRTQMFEGVVIRTDRKDSISSRITVRKIASGVGVEKSYLIHSPLVEKIEIVKRGKVRRNYLSYLRERQGKSARLAGKDFDRKAVNDVSVPEETSEKEEKETVEAPVTADENDAVKTVEEKVEEVKVDETIEPVKENVDSPVKPTNDEGSDDKG